MKKVLVTGGSGFVGRQTLLPLLARGYEVHCAGRPTDTLPPEAREHLHFHECDLLDPAARQTLIRTLQATHLLHLAWYTVHGKFWSTPENQTWHVASLALGQEFADHGGKRAVFAGSCAEYEWADKILVEDLSPLRPATIYGQAKNSLREALKPLFASTGVSWAWGRVFFLYGPYEGPSRLVSSVILKLLAGKPALCSDGHQLRDILHVADVASGLVALLDSGFEGAVNIASGEETPIREVTQAIAVKLGATPLLELGAIPRAANDPERIVADSTRLRSLGWVPQFTLDSGLDDTIAWYQRMRNAR